VFKFRNNPKRKLLFVRTDVLFYCFSLKFADISDIFIASLRKSALLKPTWPAFGTLFADKDR
jgi:hypothetical protein